MGSNWPPSAQFGPSDEYDSYAHHIVSMVAQVCSVEELFRHLGVIREENNGVESDPSRDREIASGILEALREKAF